MMTSEFLKVQLRLLVAQFGRKSVLEAFAGLSEASPEQLQEEIARLEAARRAKTPKHDKPLDELLAELPSMPERSTNLFKQLGRLFESKLFLPNLRDTEEFLRRSGAASRKFKSRRKAFGAVLKALSEMPVSELESLVAQNTHAGSQSDYSLLANQLMGKKT
jgi:hypothetical protein